MQNRLRSFPAALRARLILGLLAAAGALLGAPALVAAPIPEVARHGAAVSAANALVAEVRVSLTGAARVFVEYDNPQAGRYRTALSDPGAEHVIPIVRLRPQTTYDYTIFVAAGSSASERDAAAGPGGSFTTGALPPPLADLQVTAYGRSSQPLILSNYRRGDLPGYFVLWDETGATVWYRAGVAQPGPIAQLANGNFIFLERANLIEITPLGEVVNRFERDGEAGIPHHELSVLDDGRVLYPSSEIYVFDDSANGGAEDTTFRVDNLRVWDPASGRIEQVWDAKEAWDVRDPDQRRPGRLRDDGSFSWTHVNSVRVGPRGNVIVSVRGRHQVISLSPDLRTIEWQLSGPDSDFEFPNPRDRFYGQHTAAQLANGNVLLFDNGLLRPDAEGGRYSRALELRLDAVAGTAVKVWEYRLIPDLYSARGGSAYRLGNGNTLINFSSVPARLRDVPMTVVEVDAAGNEVFRVDTLDALRPVDRSRGRATGGTRAIMGETMLRPPA